MGGVQAFRIRKGEYAEVDLSNPGGYGNRNGSETFVYSIMKLYNGFVFSQNSKFTGKKSFLFLNTEKFSLKEMTGSPIELDTQLSSTVNLSKSSSCIYFSCFVGFLNYKGLGGSFIVLADEGRICSSIPGAKFYKIENLVFIPLTAFDREDERLLNKLDSFSRMLASFGYYSHERSASALLVDRGRRR